MIGEELIIRYVGTATVLLEVGGLRLLTDPAFDPSGTTYTTPVYTLRKSKDPLATAATIGAIDIVLLTHDHHLDNLDHDGMQFLTRVGTVYTTSAGAERLNNRKPRPGDPETPTGIEAIGIDTWTSVDIPTRDGRILSITGTPARHGPAGGDRGPVTGFLLNFKGETKGSVYITGDTVLYDGVEEVAHRFDIGLVLLFVGAARIAAVGPDHLTMTVQEAIDATRLFPHAAIIPLHFEGWEHFSEGKAEITRQFAAAGLADRLCWAPDWS